MTLLGIPLFQFHVGELSKQLKCRSLIGPEKLKLFENMDVKLLLSTVAEDSTSKIQHLWSELIELIKLICLLASKLTGKLLKVMNNVHGSEGKISSVCTILTRMINHIGKIHANPWKHSPLYQARAGEN